MAGIKIPVEAQFEKGNITQELQQFQQEFNRFGNTVAQANKVKFNPISKATLEDMKKLQAGLESLRKVSGDFNKRINATGQGGSGFFKLDWSKLYPDQHSRNRQMQKAFEYVSGAQFGAAAAGGAGGGGNNNGNNNNNNSNGNGNNKGGGQGRRAVAAGLNAMGPAGNVANNALSAGMSGGWMAGLAGLGGGLAALAIGKAVSAVKEKIGVAETENIGYDTLKRTLGDVNVGFNALKQSIRAASYELDVTFAEGQRLAIGYTKQAGLSGADHRDVAQEVATAGGFSRSFGLDPGQGTNFFAQMRMNQVTGNDQQNKRLAMMIGEGIAKSDAFSKADEVLEAIAGYTAGQTRSGMNVANVEGYTSMLTGMVGSKLPGMDVASSAALLSRMNQSIAGGGAAGEAGQNFLYSALGGKGMDPMDVTVLREQGLFGTGRGTFGSGSAYGRYASKYGLSTPDSANSDTTNFEAIQKQFEKSYGGSANARKLMANAMSNLYGITNSQAMALSTVNPAQLGGMGNRLGRLGIDVKDVNATGISRMAQIEGDSSLSESEKDKRIRQAATEGQERTMGSDIRKSTTAVENIQVQLADKLIPLTQGIRDGIMFLAGGSGKMSGRQIQEAMLTADSNDAKGQIDKEYEKKLKEAGAGRLKARQDVQDLFTKNRDKVMSGEMTQEEHARQMRPLLEREQEAIKKDAEAREWHTKALADESKLLEQRIEQLNNPAKAGDVQTTGGIKSSAGGGRGFVNPGGVSPVASNQDAQDAISYFVGKGWSREQASGIVANLMHESKLNAGAVGDGGQAYGIAQWHPDRQANFKKWAGKDITESTRAEQMGFVHYELTEGNETAAGRKLRNSTTANEAGGVVSRHYERPKYTEQEEYARGISADRLNTAGQKIGVTGEANVTVTVQSPDGRKMAPDQRVPVKISSPTPAGM